MPDLLDPLEQPDMDDLFRLREYLQRRLDDLGKTLQAFYLPESGGFLNQLAPKGSQPQEWSKASTATCIAVLYATGQLADDTWARSRTDLAKQILELKKWDSAGLGKDNAFTVAFLLEAVALLGWAKPEDGNHKATIEAKVKILRSAVMNGRERGGVSLQKYEATAFLTYKAISALKRFGPLEEPLKKAVSDWTWQHLNKECVLLAAGSQDGDVFEIAYSLLLASKIMTLDRMTPQQRSQLRYAAELFFRAQLKDGSWPRSRPLFVYQKRGHAYCYDYELLAALLADEQLHPLMQDHLGRLRLAAHALDELKYPLGEKLVDERGEPIYGWSSGHHGAVAAAESWATAAALHYCFSLSRLVAAAIRRQTFEYVGAPYTPPTTTSRVPIEKALEKFLDSPLEPAGSGNPRTLKPALQESMLEPLLDVCESLRSGQELPEKDSDGRNVPTSAILFGPPGTSKTELAKIVAKCLGWPLLALDPSHLTRHGLDQVHSEAAKLFDMLRHCEEVVVLLDEFDELMREREAGSDMESRFLTTAMLPKLAALYSERRLVYLVATNHVEKFDAAIRRQGRFAVVTPVLPPTAAAKIGHWEALSNAFARLDASNKAAATRCLEDLTFLEAKALAEDLAKVTEPAEILEMLEESNARCTMKQKFDGTEDETWSDRMSKDAPERLRGLA